jgi:predicted aspartyl protease
MVAAMIVGRVNDVGLAEIELLIRGHSGRNLLVKALIDTGFTGDLTLSRGDIEVLLLDVVGTRRGELANGEFVLFTVYRAIANWHGLDQENCCRGIKLRLPSRHVFAAGISLDNRRY